MGADCYDINIKHCAVAWEVYARDQTDVDIIWRTTIYAVDALPHSHHIRRESHGNDFLLSQQPHSPTSTISM